MADTDTSAVRGLRYIAGLAPEEFAKAESALVHHRDRIRPVPDMYGRVTEGSRQRLDFGYIYETRGGLIETEPIPDAIRDFATYLCGVLGVENDFDVCLVNLYQKGQGIGPHIDHTDLFGERIICATFNGKRTMRFSHAGDKVDIITAPCSVYMMEGDARYVWKHEMPKLKSNEPCFSVTFRKRRV